MPDGDLAVPGVGSRLSGSYQSTKRFLGKVRGIPLFQLPPIYGSQKGDRLGAF